MDRINRFGQSGLHHAVVKGSLDEVRRWLKLGASADKTVVDRERKSALLLACELNDTRACLAITKALLDGLQGSLFDDDAQLVEVRARKVYAALDELPCIELELLPYLGETA